MTEDNMLVKTSPKYLWKRMHTICTVIVCSSKLYLGSFIAVTASADYSTYISSSLEIPKGVYQTFHEWNKVKWKSLATTVMLFQYWCERLTHGTYRSHYAIGIRRFFLWLFVTTKAHLIYVSERSQFLRLGPNVCDGARKRWLSLSNRPQ